MEKFKTFLFEYRFDGGWYGFEIKARSKAEAQARYAAIVESGRFLGEKVDDDGVD